MQGGKLLLEIGGKAKGEIDSRSLSTATFSIYLDNFDFNDPNLVRKNKNPSFIMKTNPNFVRNWKRK